MRKKHMLLVAIYVDEEHPIMNHFLRPFTDEIQNLYAKGIKWKPSNSSEVTSRFIVTTCSVDAPARAAVTCLNQFNGYYGCLYCYAKGRSLGPGKLVYPLIQSYKKERSDAELRIDMAYAFDKGETRHGVKNTSSLVALPEFNIPKGVIVDAMHAVYQGVVRQHTRLLLTKKKQPYYVGNPDSIKLIDKCLLAIKPPSCRSRKPRSISTYKKWKASEWRNWLDYGPVCLKDVLPEKYVNHFALLSEAIHLLNSDSITLADLDRCKILLKSYVKLFEEYFGLRNMSSNVHSMSHLVDVVRNWGPIWVHEASTFESWNRKIMEFVTSSFAQCNQIATRFLLQKFLINTSYDDTISSDTKKFIAKQLKIPIQERNINLKNSLIGLGKCTSRSPTEIERTILNQIGYDPAVMKCFRKMKLNGVRYVSHNEKNLKFCNSTIYDGNGSFGTIVTIVKFQNNDEVIGGMFIKRIQPVGSAFNTQYIHQVTRSNSLFFVKECMLIKPAVLIASSHNLYVIKQINCWETD
ncbi:GSCOCG00011675001-RA-CDS [Cotesia congregata]|nr:GSCOCG00011675001-RA-CDS [Cotesia congregata]